MLQVLETRFWFKFGFIIHAVKILESALVGSLASGVQVSRPGNVPIYLDELLSQVDQMFQNSLLVNQIIW